MVWSEKVGYLYEDLDEHDFVLLDWVPDFFNHFFVNDMELERALSIIDDAETANYVE